MGTEAKSGAGLYKTAVGACGFAIPVFASAGQVVEYVERLPGTNRALFATVLLALFVVYALIDLVNWYEDWAVWVANPLAMAIAAYWWVGFMAMHGYPQEPLLPAHLYPPAWAYYVMAGCLVVWALWDILAAMKEGQPDKEWVGLGGGAIIVAIALSLLMTFKPPTAS